MPDTCVPLDGGRTLIHHGSEGWLRISGSERKVWLQGITTANVLATREQSGFWGLFLDRAGKIRHEVIGIVEPTAILLFPLSHGLAPLHQYLDSMLVMEDVEIGLEPDTSLWSLHAATVDDATSAFDKALAWGTLQWFTPRDRVAAVRVADEPAWLARVRAAGVTLANASKRESLRIAAGVPRWGVDYTDADTPHHAGLFGRAVAPDKGCYVGQEVVCKVEMRGHVPQRVAHLVLDAGNGVSAGEQVTSKSSGEIVGAVTSVSPEPIGGRLHALARVRTAALQDSEFLVGATSARVSNENPPA